MRRRLSNLWKKLSRAEEPPQAQPLPCSILRHSNGTPASLQDQDDANTNTNAPTDLTFIPIDSRLVTLNATSIEKLRSQISLQNLTIPSESLSNDLAQIRLQTSTFLSLFEKEDLSFIEWRTSSGSHVRMPEAVVDNQVHEPMTSVEPRKSILRQSNSIHHRKSSLLCLFDSDTFEPENPPLRCSSEKILNKMLLNVHSDESIPSEYNAQDEVKKPRSILRNSSRGLCRNEAVFCFIDAETSHVADIVDFRQSRTRVVLCVPPDQETKSNKKFRLKAKRKVEKYPRISKERLKQLDDSYEAAQEVSAILQKSVLFQTPSRLTTVIDGEVHPIESPSQMSLGSFSDASSNSDITYRSCDSDESDASVCMYSNNS